MKCLVALVVCFCIAEQAGAARKFGLPFATTKDREAKKIAQVLRSLDVEVSIAVSETINFVDTLLCKIVQDNISLNIYIYLFQDGLQGPLISDIFLNKNMSYFYHK